MKQTSNYTAVDEEVLKEENEDPCEVRMNGVCYDDLEEALFALARGRQAGTPKAPKSKLARHNWTKKKIVISLKGGRKQSAPNGYVVRPERDLKRLIITTHGYGKSKE